MNERKVTKFPVGSVPIHISKVGVYCRVSSNRIEQLRSMAFQASHLTRTALNTRGWIFVDFHSGFRKSYRKKYLMLFRLEKKDAPIFP